MTKTRYMVKYILQFTEKILNVFYDSTEIIDNKKIIFKSLWKWLIEN